MSTNWFDSLELVWKFTLVFGILMVMTILAGFMKVLYNRQRLKKYERQQADVEAQRDDRMELNQREKDEGDLFGIRAIEAGFYAGVAQSRPTSSAGGTLAGTPNMSTNTLVGSFSSPKIQSHSVNSSITSVPPAHLSNRDSDRNSDLLLSGTSTPRRKTPPTLKLQPSEAELHGRHIPVVGVNMNLTVPPSPRLPEPPKSPTFSITDFDAPKSPLPSPRSPGLMPGHYVPSAPPQIPMPDGLRASIFSTKSQTPSYLLTSGPQSPTSSTPPSPSSPSFVPEARAPSGYFDYKPRSPGHPVYSTDPQSGETGSGSPDEQEDRRTSQPILQPLTYQPTHGRQESDASSIYTDHRKSTYHNRSTSSESINYSLPYSTTLASTAYPNNIEQPRTSIASSLHAPSSAQGSTAESRLSDFYDAYYRQSTLYVPQKAPEGKRPPQLTVAPPSPIVEVPTPISSPMPAPLSPRRPDQQFGAAL